MLFGQGQESAAVIKPREVIDERKILQVPMNSVALDRVAQRTHENGAVQVLSVQKILDTLPQRLHRKQFVFAFRQNDHGRIRRGVPRRLHIGAALPLSGSQVNQQNIRRIAGETLGGEIEVRDVLYMKLGGIFSIQ